ncbi:putative MPP superfamily phosphohydrolase [Saccharothrix coeruleofusca]|uniref:metallophosphoesterase n=1 Tax=Saccharothrix coeruleofusca TaxID=33919 RepID=UPI001AE7F83E|nr:metallophosphoesterase [Saccharothrix coeruleofusca]MBP2336833.1 putative MPP superfamily phosphohydrolase [Saccharothrix coeruleofusca]
MSSTTSSPPRSAPRRRLAFVAVLVTVATLLFWVPWFGLFPPSAQWPWPVTVTSLLLFGTAYVAFPVLLVRAHGRRRSDRAARIAHLMLGVSWVAFAWTLITDVVRLVLLVAGVDNPLRARVVSVLLAVVVVVLVAHGSVEARRVPRVRRAEIVLPRLDRAFDGLTIAVLADTHYGAIDRTRWSRAMVAAVNAAEPDVVVHVGDIADGTVAQRRGQAAALGEVRASARFYVSGNHEYLSNAQAWLEHMSELGWTSLHNQHRVLERGGARLVFAGVDDVTGSASGEPGHGDDLGAALAGTRPDDPVVLLAHQPSEVGKAAAAGVDLQLSGHTHGGQIWPFHHLVRLQQPVLSGLSGHGERTQLWTSRGAGFWGPQLRVFAPSEISLLTLRAPR